VKLHAHRDPLGKIILADFAPGEVRIVNCGHHPPVRPAPNTTYLRVEVASMKL
jgi:hypothetical protein